MWRWNKRWLLWGALALLVSALLVLLIWLAARYEIAQSQDKLERDVQDASADIRAGLLRNIQSIQALRLSDNNIETFRNGALRLMQERRELLRIERRSVHGALLELTQTPYLQTLVVTEGPQGWSSAVEQACAAAKRLSGPAYAPSQFVPQGEGVGFELMAVCLPQQQAGELKEYLIGLYSLQGILAEWVSGSISRGQEISFTEGDGTRLAIHGRAPRSLQGFSVQQILDLPGNPMVLRIDSWRSTPGLFPNVLTALVAALTLGMVAVVALLGHDMRRRQKAERDLAEAFAFRKAMEDSLVTGLRARDVDGRITYVNPAFCEMVGFAAEELLGRSAPAPYWPTEQIDEYRRRQAVRLAGNAPPREGFESVFMRKGGERFPVLIFEAPLINAQGQQTGWMSAILDVTEQRRVEEISRASQDRLQATARLATVGEMASLLSHELNQPLAAISSYATGSLNLLSSAQSNRSDIQEAVQRIAQQADRAGKVIKSVHDFVRRRDEERQNVIAADLLDSVRPLIDMQARKFSTRVNIRVSGGLPPCHCDRTMVEQVLLNLARNGIQAMQNTAVPSRQLDISVHLTGSETQRWLMFTVADCGTGIDPEVATQLFTPFFTTKAEGMGLGLSMCRTVIEQHGGYLEYQANQPCGTVFVFTLPAARKTEHDLHR
jgi:two-component system, LuxR family, sensor histidine kinase DctS